MVILSSRVSVQVTEAQEDHGPGEFIDSQCIIVSLHQTNFSSPSISGLGHGLTHIASHAHLPEASHIPDPQSLVASPTPLFPKVVVPVDPQIPRDAMEVIVEATVEPLIADQERSLIPDPDLDPDPIPDPSIPDATRGVGHVPTTRDQGAVHTPHDIGGPPHHTIDEGTGGVTVVVVHPCRIDEGTRETGYVKWAGLCVCVSVC